MRSKTLRRGRGAALALIAALVAGAAPSGVGSAEAASGCGRILFRAEKERRMTLATIRPDGSGRRRLLEPRRGYLLNAEWSPDGRRIAYIRVAPEWGRSGVYVMNADGSGRRRLTGRRRWHAYLSWSPNGREIAYARTRPDGTTRIFVVRVRDGRRRLLVAGTTPAWSPDGGAIAFARPVEDSLDLAVIPAGGGEAVAVTRSSAADDSGPAWSPDGRWLAFDRVPHGQELENDYHGPYGDVWKVASDGSEENQLTDANSAFHGFYGPRWAPDGTRIAFSYEWDDGGSVYVMRPDGSDQTRASWSDLNDGSYSPDWAPTSRRLAFADYGDLFVARLSDGRRRSLTRTRRVSEDYPRWSKC